MIVIWSPFKWLKRRRHRSANVRERIKQAKVAAWNEAHRPLRVIKPEEIEYDDNGDMVMREWNDWLRKALKDDRASRNQ